MKKLMVLTLLGGMGLAFTMVMRVTGDDEPVYVPASPQRSGDAAAGYRYLTTGDYIKSGIPYNYFLLGFGKKPDSLLRRGGLNADIPYAYTAVKAANGEEVVAPNCMQCHAQVFDGKLYIGLGNSMIDFSDRRKFGYGSTDVVEPRKTLALRRVSFRPQSAMRLLTLAIPTLSSTRLVAVLSE